MSNLVHPSEETKQELMQELDRDAMRMHDMIMKMGFSFSQQASWTYRDLEQLEYVTAQMRLKLKFLGASGIWTDVI